MDKLLHEVIVISASTIACLNEVTGVLFWVAFPSIYKNLGGWYSVGIQRLSSFFTYGLEHVSKSLEEPSYYALIVLAVMYWSCWIDKYATEVE